MAFLLNDFTEVQYSPPNTVRAMSIQLSLTLSRRVVPVQYSWRGIYTLWLPSKPSTAVVRIAHQRSTASLQECVLFHLIIVFRIYVGNVSWKWVFSLYGKRTVRCDSLVNDEKLMEVIALSSSQLTKTTCLSRGLTVVVNCSRKCGTV